MRKTSCFRALARLHSPNTWRVKSKIRHRVFKVPRGGSKRCGGEHASSPHFCLRGALGLTTTDQPLPASPPPTSSARTLAASVQAPRFASSRVRSIGFSRRYERALLAGGPELLETCACKRSGVPDRLAVCACCKIRQMSTKHEWD